MDECPEFRDLQMSPVVGLSIHLEDSFNAQLCSRFTHLQMDCTEEAFSITHYE